MDDLPVTVGMVEESVRHGLILVQFVPDSPDEAPMVEMWLPAVPRDGDPVFLDGVPYLADRPQWLFWEGTFTPFTLRVKVMLRRVAPS